MASSSSSSVPIPPRQQRLSSSSYSSSASADESSCSSTPPKSYTPSPSSSSVSKGKQAVGRGGSEMEWGIAPRRPSLLGTSLSKSEHTVINLGDDEGPPRLVTCVKSSQGFDWNQELFLPSYAYTFDAQELEHKQDPVHDIVLSEEDAAALLPQ